MAELQSDSEILEFAIAKEIEANKLYTALAQRVTDPFFRNLFNDLAVEELDHKAKLELEVIKLGRTVQPPRPDLIPEHEYIISDTDEPLDMDYRDLLMLGIEKEESSFRIYVELFADTQDPQSRELLLAIAQEEVKHKLRFEDELDILQNKKTT